MSTQVEQAKPAVQEPVIDCSAALEERAKIFEEFEKIQKEEYESLSLRFTQRD